MFQFIKYAAVAIVAVALGWLVISLILPVLVIGSIYFAWQVRRVLLTVKDKRHES